MSIYYPKYIFHIVCYVSVCIDMFSLFQKRNKLYILHSLKTLGKNLNKDKYMTEIEC